MDFHGNVLILGLAREGVSLARFLAERGAAVTITDSAPGARLRDRLEAVAHLPVRTVVGGDYPELVRQADRFFVSPGVPESNPVYRAALDAGLAIESMTTLFFELCPSPIIGVTGSSGKTTTTGLIGHILRTAGRKSAVGGNIGDPMLDLLPVLGGHPEGVAGTIVVLELSSFQLSILRRSPHIAVVTNISPNHLDRHGTMEAYVDAKLNIVRHQSSDDWVVLNAEDERAHCFAAATPAAVRWFGGTHEDGAREQGGCLGLQDQGRFSPVMPTDSIPLLGRHNIQNVLAAVTATAILGIQPHHMARAIAGFRPAPHRLELVAERNGVQFIDDSIATSPARAIVALEAIDAPILLIAGGRDKKLPWEELAALAVQKARGLFLIGEAADSIAAVVSAALRTSGGLLVEENIVPCGTLEEAVRAASACARPGEVVLLSPGCASYDMFRDFEERGHVFAQAVEMLDAA